MNRNIRLLYFIGIFAVICFLSLSINEISNRVDEQKIIHAADPDEYNFLPIIHKPTEPKYKIVFSSDRNRASRVNDIYSMDMNGENVEMLTDTPDIVEDNPVWSPDGTMIAYISGGEGQEEIFVMNADGSNKRNVSNSGSSRDRNFVWSPDSRQISFISNRTGGRYDLFVVNADGSGLTNLTQTSDADEWGIDWSPDGSKIVYLSDKTQTPYPLSGGDMIVMNANGSNKTVIFNDTGWNRPAVWTPNGSKLTFSIYNECIASVNPDGTGLIPCYIESPVKETISHFKWNPTSTKLIFESGAFSTDYYIYNSATGQISKISSGSPIERVFNWSADSSQIIGHGSVNGKYQILMMDADGSNTQNLTETTEVNNFKPNLSAIKLR